MTARSTPRALAAILAGACIPVLLPAQARTPARPSVPRIAVTPALPPAPAPAASSGAYGPVLYSKPWVAPWDRVGDRAGGRHGARWYALPYSVETGVTRGVPVPYPVPYPVYGGYAAPNAATPEAPKPAPPPYDPTKASVRVIGVGADGGAGVMRIERIEPDSLRVVWLGAKRPVREARLFVADGAYQPLRSVAVDDDRREGRFRLDGLAGPAEYAGVAIVHADGSRMTVLVPLRVGAR